MAQTFDGCGKLKKPWPRLWPKQEPPTGRSKRKPTPPMGKLERRISIVLNMSEEKLRAIIRDEVAEALDQHEAYNLEELEDGLGLDDKTSQIRHRIEALEKVVEEEG